MIEHATMEQRVEFDAGVLDEFEAGLNPGEPERSEIRPEIIGYGEVSTTFVISALPQLACKRMAGFSTPVDAKRYIETLERYLESLRTIGVTVVATQWHLIAAPGSRPVVYLIQPLLDTEGLGHKLLHTADDKMLQRCIDRVFDYALRLHDHCRDSRNEFEIAVDGQLSNWHFPLSGDDPLPPQLIDVGTPLMRRDGEHELDTRFLLAPVPVAIRWYYRWQRAVETYLDHYFDIRALLVDLLGNFYKEGRPDRIMLAAEHINGRLGVLKDDAISRPITVDEVQRYYQQDVASLELYLKVRRIDRFVQTRMLKRRYNFTLPGPVAR